ncbi:MAG: SWIM zinc finger family protein [Haloferacaceae archaeon]
MTHTRNTPASAPTEAGDPRPLDRKGRPTDSDSAPRPADDSRAERARTEPMTVRPLRDGRYVVETEGGTYVVDLAEGTCTCPDHAIRGARCKHLRRVAMAVTGGGVPAPDERRSACAVCGAALFVPMTADGPHLCDRHEHAPGDVVRDRETGGLLVVRGATSERADEHRTEEGRLVADYPTNAAYGAHEPVVLAVYLTAGRDDDGDPQRYAFPASRLAPVDSGVASRLDVPVPDDGAGDGD